MSRFGYIWMGFIILAIGCVFMAIRGMECVGAGMAVIGLAGMVKAIFAPKVG